MDILPVLVVDVHVHSSEDLRDLVEASALFQDLVHIHLDYSHYHMHHGPVAAVGKGRVGLDHAEWVVVQRSPCMGAVGRNRRLRTPYSCGDGAQLHCLVRLV